MSDTSIKPRIEKVPAGERFFQMLPVLLVPLLAAAGLAAIGNPASWLTLTVAGLAMGMMIFIMASGLTVVFGLMDVINFGHGAFVAVGAFVGHFRSGLAGGLDRVAERDREPCRRPHRHPCGDGRHRATGARLRAGDRQAGLLST
jgi:hypothetical protein